MLPTNTSKNDVFPTFLFISERHYKYNLIVAHFIQVPSCVDVDAYVSRILQKNEWHSILT